MIDGVSLAKAAQRCGVHYTTAFRWRHRYLASLAGDKPKTLTGIVEGDETFVLKSFKGKQSGMPRKSRKKCGKSAKRGLSAEQIPVIVARDRHGATTDAMLPKLNRLSTSAALDGVITRPTILLRWRHGNCRFRTSSRHRGSRSTDAGQTKAPDFHLNNVNAYHGRLKGWRPSARGRLRRFHGVATKNLPNYLGWRRTSKALGQNATTAGSK